MDLDARVVLGFFTSVWYSGFLFRCFQQPLINGSWADKLYGPRPDGVRWALAIFALIAYGVAVTVVPHAFDILEKWQHKGADPVPPKVLLPQLGMAGGLIALSFGLFAAVPSISTAFQGVSAQERFVTVFALGFLFAARLAQFVVSILQ